MMYSVIQLSLDLICVPVTGLFLYSQAKLLYCKHKLKESYIDFYIIIFKNVYIFCKVDRPHAST